ncbi:hypothetical protein [Corynebacterium pseudodiphtheriticum]|uniref:DUF732 domain-containing protein n=1 Tax=Corynebacterium pseudodiphtheriticum TaxID=37637 RepID=A0AAP4F7C8_9CORY|nr:hypothetical protein [Corynebacterium pseudodiphtheriticum]MCT1635506.1 hypothetical protein [Corynebacterium pseudodiphtheriticum]MCT1666601.1 hypothetical protein [Corynebacterium pseudodiphtheriticum]MDC7067881.1 hypothetical protein [Corynebacterium pseudodiphtheriticum]MDC7084051.1 hypothetical protein [Corynebacterium pseudodiphtheriticum]MDC7086398.1 hypothetical protein [Corynebacterium pseudodiphtheriticum]
MRFTRSTGIRSVGAFRNTGVRRRKASLVAALTTGALVLAACGSATVEDEAPETLSKSSTQTTKSTAASSTTSPGAGKDDKDGKDGKKSSEGSTTAKSGSGQNSAGNNNAEPAPQTAGGRDRGAQEIDEIPETNPFEGENAAFLDDVRALGVDVAGVEGQVVSAGYLVCDEQTAILQAVAGQLIGQQRTDREFEDLVDKLTESARGRFC